jgi:hypothetical protein
MLIRSGMLVLSRKDRPRDEKREEVLPGEAGGRFGHRLCVTHDCDVIPHFWLKERYKDDKDSQGYSRAAGSSR